MQADREMDTERQLKVEKEKDKGTERERESEREREKERETGKQQANHINRLKYKAKWGCRAYDPKSSKSKGRALASL